jgi:hypothetical protein
MKRGMLKLIDEDEDDVRFYAAPVDLRMFGARRLPEGVYVFGKGAAEMTNAARNGASNDATPDTGEAERTASDE